MLIEPPSTTTNREVVLSGLRITLKKQYLRTCTYFSECHLHFKESFEDFIKWGNECLQITKQGDGLRTKTESRIIFVQYMLIKR